MSEIVGKLTFFSIVIITAIVFVAVAVFVMFSILCANVAQMKKTLRKILEATNKRKNHISVDYLTPKT